MVVSSPKVSLLVTTATEAGSLSILVGWPECRKLPHILREAQDALVACLPLFLGHRVLWSVTDPGHRGPREICWDSVSRGPEILSVLP